MSDIFDIKTFLTLNYQGKHDPKVYDLIVSCDEDTSKLSIDMIIGCSELDAQRVMLSVAYKGYVNLYESNFDDLRSDLVRIIHELSADIMLDKMVA